MNGLADTRDANRKAARMQQDHFKAAIYKQALEKAKQALCEDMDLERAIHIIDHALEPAE